MLSMKKIEHQVELIGPKGIRTMLEAVFQHSQTFLNYRLEIIELETTKEIGWRDGWHISAYPLTHRVPCFGYVLREANYPGRFQAKIAISLGVPKDQLTSISKGIPYQFENGQTITLDDCRGSSMKGRHIVLLGDTSNSEEIAAAAEGCDVLVHEATFDETEEERALSCGHSTTKMSASFANKINAKQLILTHFSCRYEQPWNKHLKASLNQFIDEAQKYSPNTIVHLAQDLWSFDIPPPQ